VGAGNAGGGVISGVLQPPPELSSANVLVGVFADSVPQCGPVAFTALHNAGGAQVVLNNVPDGRWWVIAAAQRPGLPGEVYLGRHRRIVEVAAGKVSRIGMRMRKLEPTDVPLAFTLAATASVTGGQRPGAGRPVLNAA
jgi:hypothetical protein